MNVNEIKAKLAALQNQKNAGSGTPRKQNYYKTSDGKEVNRRVPSK